MVNSIGAANENNSLIESKIKTKEAKENSTCNSITSCCQRVSRVAICTLTFPLTFPSSLVLDYLGYDECVSSAWVTMCGIPCGAEERTR